MKLNEGMFAIKLYELEQQYGRMQSRLRLCQQEKHSKIQKELQSTEKMRYYCRKAWRAAGRRQSRRWQAPNWIITEQ